MRGRRGEGKANQPQAANPDREQGAGPSGPGSRRLPQPAATSLDHLEYLADMIAELRTMAEDSKCPTLTGLLDLAVQEAHLETARRSRADEPARGASGS